MCVSTVAGESTPFSLAARHDDSLFDLYNPHARGDVWSWLCKIRFSTGLCEPPFFSGITLGEYNVAQRPQHSMLISRSDFLVVQPRRIANAYGHVACWQYHFEYHVWIFCRWYPAQHGERCLSTFVAVFLPDRRSSKHSRSHCRLLLAPRLAREHKMAERGRTRNGTVPCPAVEWRQGRKGRRHLEWVKGCLRGSFHLDVLRNALQLDQCAVVQGFLPICKSATSRESGHRLTHRQIFETFGFSELETYLVQAPPFAVAYASACA